MSNGLKKWLAMNAGGYRETIPLTAPRDGGRSSQAATPYIRNEGGDVLSPLQDHKERRHGTRLMVRNLLAERQEVLVSYCRLAGLEPYTGDKPVRRQLDEFCQLLMDYTAFGHFELYGRISEGEERRERVVGVAKDVYSKIAVTTEQAVAFNDKYDASDHNLNLEPLPGDLSALGERLAQRMELEDQLVSALIEDLPEESGV